MYDGFWEPKEINIQKKKDTLVKPKEVTLPVKKDEKIKHQVKIVEFGSSSKKVANYNLTNAEIMKVSSDVKDCDFVRSLIRRIDITDTVSIINFDEDITTSSRDIISKLLELNLSITNKMPEYFAEIANVVKSSYKRQGLFDYIFGFGEKVTIKDSITKIEKIEKKINKEIPKILSSIKYIEDLYENSKTSLNTLNCYIVALEIIIKEFNEEIKNNHNDLDKKLYESNIALLERKLFSLTGIKLSMMSDPHVIFNMRQVYITQIDMYKTSIVTLIHEWKNECNLELNNKKNNFKKSGKSIVSIIDKTLAGE